MIELTRLKGAPVYLNPDLIETIEETPDTVITLVDGKKVLVSETAATVAERICVCRAAVLTIVARLEDRDRDDRDRDDRDRADRDRDDRRP